MVGIWMEMIKHEKVEAENIWKCSVQLQENQQWKPSNTSALPQRQGYLLALVHCRDTVRNKNMLSFKANKLKCRKPWDCQLAIKIYFQQKLTFCFISHRHSIYRSAYCIPVWQKSKQTMLYSTVPYKTVTLYYTIPGLGTRKDGPCTKHFNQHIS